MARPKAVIIGAGALGLGYLTERMAEDYDICLADLSDKQELLEGIFTNQCFTVNICGLDGIEQRRVKSNISIALTDTDEGAKILESSLREADLVFTVTGRGILDSLVDKLAPVINEANGNKWLLFCENGLNIADAYRGHFRPGVTLVDTVMSRMCRFSQPCEHNYCPMNGDSSASLVVESYSYLPVEADLIAGGPFTSAFALVSLDDFLCWEDIKVYMHNGMHAYVSYHAHLEGVRYFKDTPAHIRDSAERVMLKEVVPAISRTHPSMDRGFLMKYGVELLARYFNPYFNDNIERGVRGVRAKLAPEERLLGGCNYIRNAGIEPVGYSSTVRAAEQILALSL